MERLRLSVECTHIDPTAFVASTAVVIGDVQLAARSSVWFGAVIRGDVERIRVGENTNIQDGTILHADEGFPCLLGVGVTVGHRCIIHGTTVQDGCMIGMGAVTMNGAVIGAESLIGAGALVTQNKCIPPRSLVLGSPAKVIRQLTASEVDDLRRAAAHYVEMSRAYSEYGT